MNACVLANGVLPSRAVVRRYARSADLLVCADGGANRAAQMGLRPTLIIGDLDSLTAGIRRKFRGEPVVRRTTQYATDLEKAIQFCIRKGCSSAVILGATGGRTDHTAGNLGCFKRFGRKIELKMVETEGEISM